MKQINLRTRARSRVGGTASPRTASQPRPQEPRRPRGRGAFRQAGRTEPAVCSAGASAGEIRVIMDDPDDSRAADPASRHPRPAPGGAAPRGCICSRRSPRRRGRAHVERRAVPPVSLCSSTPHAHPLARRSADCRGRCHWPRQKLVAAHTGEYGNNSDLNVSS